MIQSLQIINFQSHKDTKLEFHEGVNIIVGPSDSGKTAIIRALRWAIWNRPGGNGMRSNWGGDTWSIITLDDNSRVSRGKAEKEMYEYKGKLYEAFRTEVPEDIVKGLNITDINLQRQLDSPFLLSDSPGEVAQHFNKVARLDKIDSATNNINSQIRKLESGIKYNESQRDVKIEELDKFEHLEKFEIEVEVLEKLEEEYINLLRSETKLETLIENVKDKEAEIKEVSQILELEEPVNDLLELYKEKEEVQSRYRELDQLCEDIQTVSNKYERTIQQVEELEEEFNNSFPDVCPLCGKPK